MSPTPSASSDAAPRRLYGRAKGHPLSARQQALVEGLGETLTWPDDGPLDPAELLPGFERHVLEIGSALAQPSI